MAGAIRQNKKAGNERKYNSIYATGLMVRVKRGKEGRSDNKEWWKHELTQGRWI